MSKKTAEDAAPAKPEEDDSQPHSEEHHEVSRLEYVARHGLVPPKVNLFKKGKPPSRRATPSGSRRPSGVEGSEEGDVRLSISETADAEYAETKPATLAFPRVPNSASTSRRTSPATLNVDADDSLFSPNSESRSTISAGGGNMKKKLAGIEEYLDRQVGRQDETDRRIFELEQVVVNLQGLIREMVREMGEKLMERIVGDKEELDHRFELQSAENKRLQQHVSALKAENVALQRRLVASEERISNLEAELGGDDS